MSRSGTEQRRGGATSEHAVLPAGLPVSERQPAPAGTERVEAPGMVLWETTRACDLACAHCRDAVVCWRDLRELSTLEAMLLMNRARQFGRPGFVLTGGDPAKRPDLVELVEHGSRIGLPMALRPSATPLMTAELLRRLRSAGLERLAVGLDGSTAAVHDAFRGVPGSHEWTLAVVRAALALGLPVEVNTLVMRHIVSDLEALAGRLAALGIARWCLVFPPPSARIRGEDLLTAEESEAALQAVHALSTSVPLAIESADAPQYLFIGHTGEIHPSRYLPVSAGNVRTHDIVEVYRTSPVFRGLRDRARLPLPT